MSTEPKKISREAEVKAQLAKLNFDPVEILVEATNSARDLMNESIDEKERTAAISLVQRGSKMILDELKEARKLESEKKGNTYLMIPTGFDESGNAIFENRLLNG